ncbi:hypothetical protein TON_0793 [Thermococcus onnurineus NA1]|uniref:Uncharacterized protein n=1 Tax=Thermococcus onnurineus (strain NA1) TaxID=523850 RepID=B6YVV8_THEON|nr:MULTISPECIES: hypothetical protein [Thermococcus]ACJ16281.1 hypothetical protein TON_0793 [Thermococcus onnurineus NA1]NJE47639.1 hypothetical protein [Thermococcus sp. GR7]NJE78947.1 hypothetical protein [Thermococcus sp. GR4]NJF22597.1 hypothetical protein [Thermococcus sp. GR5]
MEIEVSPEELAEIRKNQREIERRFRDLEGLERTLKALKLRFLLEQRARLEKRLSEMRQNYREMLEFEDKAKRDKEFLMAFRKELSDENKNLRKELGEER